MVGTQAVFAPTTFSYAPPNVQSISPFPVPINSQQRLDIIGTNFGVNLSSIQVVINKSPSLLSITSLRVPLSSLPDICSSKVLIQPNTHVLCIATAHDKAETINLVCLIYVFVLCAPY